MARAEGSCTLRSSKETPGRPSGAPQDNNAPDESSVVAEHVCCQKEDTPRRNNSAALPMGVSPFVHDRMQDVWRESLRSTHTYRFWDPLEAASLLADEMDSSSRYDYVIRCQEELAAAQAEEQRLVAEQQRAVAVRRIVPSTILAPLHNASNAQAPPRNASAQPPLKRLRSSARLV